MRAPTGVVQYGWGTEQARMSSLTPTRQGGRWVGSQGPERSGVWRGGWHLDLHSDGDIRMRACVRMSVCTSVRLCVGSKTFGDLPGLERAESRSVSRGTRRTADRIRIDCRTAVARMIVCMMIVIVF